MFVDRGVIGFLTSNPALSVLNEHATTSESSNGVPIKISHQPKIRVEYHGTMLQSIVPKVDPTRLLSKAEELETKDASKPKSLRHLRIMIDSEEGARWSLPCRESCQ